MVALLMVASVVPLSIAATLDIYQARQRFGSNISGLLAAGAEHLIDNLDDFHRAYERSLDVFIQLPEVVAFCRTQGDISRLKPKLESVFNAYLNADSNIYGIFILDMRGGVRASADETLVGEDFSTRSYVRAALAGDKGVSEIHFSEASGGFTPTVAYLTPVLGTNGERIAIAMLRVRASAIWEILNETKEQVGSEGFAALFDSHGICIGDTSTADRVFHPAGHLDPALVRAFVAEHRFGDRTREYLEDEKEAPEQFARALMDSLDPSVFRTFASGVEKWTYGIERKTETVPWTLFCMMPEEVLKANVAQINRQKSLFIGGIVLITLLAGSLFALIFLRPIRVLSNATQSIANGDLTARVRLGRTDELGRLAAGFNAMVDRIEAQTMTLEKMRDSLEIRVQERTAELVESTRNLEVEGNERRLLEGRLRKQSELLNLLHQIIQSIDERQEVEILFHKIVSFLEGHLPIDFGCICLYQPGDPVLKVVQVGVKSESHALTLGLTNQDVIAVDGGALTESIKGQSVYEPDMVQMQSPFPQRLVRAGLRSLVIAPLRLEEQVFGVLVVARGTAEAFLIEEREFLNQLGEHVALALQQAKKYAALEQAYQDLRQMGQRIGPNISPSVSA